MSDERTCDHLWALYSKPRNIWPVFERSAFGRTGKSRDQGAITGFEGITPNDLYFCQRDPTHMRMVEKYRSV